MNILLIFALFFMPIERIDLVPIERIVLSAGEVVVRCDCRCRERTEFREFFYCLRGPPYYCEPLITLDGMIVGWLNHFRLMGTGEPDTICRASFPPCWKFDRDSDGDVDLYDWALRSAGDWGTRASITATPRRVRP